MQNFENSDFTLNLFKGTARTIHLENGNKDL